MSLWILDTDSVSLFQRGNLEIARRLNIIDAREIAITIVTVEEQLRGRFQVIRRAAANDLVSPYEKLQVTFDSLKSFNILRFTPKAQELYTNLLHQKIKVGRQDLRIAAIALSVDGILVTRNNRDFSQVPNLVLENWTL
ncbi:MULTISPECIES: type II toxin-antitoxin system VapC family toxin [Nostoc]|uniref:Type II toxin-antitoxin system VapC family toxin n=1 Tax=Nostoc paludosum FACHB-159 TaxID=2692908 RepID=A0ABR8K014_9NOSO|nr:MULTISPECIES: type II toxin-antitoxin system VapC family toxin [Nostoc]MBD2681979.1 type II toxin-antitoxin system VapC family toxin [Nostoc sp. FACHB-857]MBD2732829.1 type II toxin-antitoxin system VapC family toxin [Nostoc paludosum FACHB-159]